MQTIIKPDNNILQNETVTNFSHKYSSPSVYQPLLQRPTGFKTIFSATDLFPWNEPSLLQDHEKG